MGVWENQEYSRRELVLTLRKILRRLICYQAVFESMKDYVCYALL